MNLMSLGIVFTVAGFKVCVMNVDRFITERKLIGRPWIVYESRGLWLGAKILTVVDVEDVVDESRFSGELGRETGGL